MSSATADQDEAQLAPTADDVPERVEYLDLDLGRLAVDGHVELPPAAFTRALLWAGDALALDPRSTDATMDRRRRIQRGIHAPTTNEVYAFGKLTNDGAIDVRIVGEHQEAAVWLVLYEVCQHLRGQDRALDGSRFCLCAVFTVRYNCTKHGSEKVLPHGNATATASTTQL